MNFHLELLKKEIILVNTRSKCQYYSNKSVLSIKNT